MRNRNLALTATLAIAAMGCRMPAMTAATPMHKRPTREEEKRAERARCDRKDALDAAEEKRKRKNAKRLANAKKVGAGRTAHDWECISPGEYDSLYECRKCGARHMEQADRLGSDRPRFGCPLFEQQLDDAIDSKLDRLELKL